MDVINLHHHVVLLLAAAGQPGLVSLSGSYLATKYHALVPYTYSVALQRGAGRRHHLSVLCSA